MDETVILDCSRQFEYKNFEASGKGSPKFFSFLFNYYINSSLENIIIYLKIVWNIITDE